MNPLVFEKLAASLGAQRNKQYWQMLKRLYGGTEDAVNALKNTHDFGIYHGTTTSNADSILQHGLLDMSNSPAYYTHGEVYGKGLNFGDREIGTRYNKGYEGGLLRLKYPRELDGTKLMYPNPSSVVKADTTDPRVADNMVSNVARRQVINMRRTYPDGEKNFYYVGSEPSIRAMKKEMREKDKQIWDDVHKNVPVPAKNDVKARYYGKMSTGESGMDDPHMNSFVIQQARLDPNMLRKA